MYFTLGGGADVEIMVDLGIIVPRKFLVKLPLFCCKNEILLSNCPSCIAEMECFSLNLVIIDVANTALSQKILGRKF